MEESAIKKKRALINWAIRLLPLFTLHFYWASAFDITLYAGIVYALKNKASCVAGMIAMFIPLFVPLKRSYKYAITIIGSLIFWGPLFYGACTTTKNIRWVTTECWISLAIVIFSCFLQIKVIQKEKDE